GFLLHLARLVGANVWPDWCGFRRRRVAVYPSEQACSLDLDMGRLDHLAPPFGFGDDESSEIGGRARERRRAEIGQPRLYLGLGKREVDLLIQLVDDCGGCGPWCRNPEPIAGLEARQKLADG